MTVTALSQETRGVHSTNAAFPANDGLQGLRRVMAVCSADTRYAIWTKRLVIRDDFRNWLIRAA
jgi:hypothetical protein